MNSDVPVCSPSDPKESWACWSWYLTCLHYSWLKWLISPPWIAEGTNPLNRRLKCWFTHGCPSWEHTQLLCCRNIVTCCLIKPSLCLPVAADHLFWKWRKELRPQSAGALHQYTLASTNITALSVAHTLTCKCFASFACYQPFENNSKLTLSGSLSKREQSSFIYLFTYLFGWAWR